MRTVTELPRRVRHLEDLGIVMPDGTRLSAALWLPEDAEAHPVPAIVEHLPYRKRDGTAVRDALIHPWLAGHGYACLRIDMRGNGDSEGIMEDEYTEEELRDAVDALAWIAAQPWCTGRAGMMGISWGGFNALQVAALRPPALKAVVTVASTDDRYADDIHYKGGALLGENFGWGATMLSYSSRPPDPALVGDAWRDLWLARLRADRPLHVRWLRHQARDGYWQHGSVCEDWGAIEAAVLAVGGWNDAYRNAVSRLVTNLKAPAKGIVGPWVHKYPHIARPEPIGFLQEMLRWWDRWLKDVETGVEADPDMRLFLMESARPRTGAGERRAGRWIAEPVWPSPRIKTETLHLAPDRRLGLEPVPIRVRVSSPATCGLAGGEFSAMRAGPELPGDQRRDDALSAIWDGPALDRPRAIVGAPVVKLTLVADRPAGQIAVRLCDVHPDGASTRITWGVLNLAHRDGHEEPEPLVPGEAIAIRLQLDDIAYELAPGHRLRLTVSSACWPLLWPSPATVALTISEGRLVLPLRPDGGPEVRFEAPEAAAPRAMTTLREPSSARRIVEDQASGTVVLEIEDDLGAQRDGAHGLETGARASERWSIHPGDPLSARASARWEQTVGRDDWRTRTEAVAEMTADAERFRLTGSLRAWEGEALVFEQAFDETVPRGLL